MDFYYAAKVTAENPAQRKVVFSTKEGGEVALDRRLANLWYAAGRYSLHEIIRMNRKEGISSEITRTALYCLVEAGLLRSREPKPELSQVPTEVVETACQPGHSVSAVVVNYHSKEWLPHCMDSIRRQTCRVDEIVLVENGSHDGSVDWIKKHYPEVVCITLSEPHSLAYALNRGVSASNGDLLLLLNPDIRMEADALCEMVKTINSRPKIAAVTPKIKFMWAPGFLNGIGNRIVPFYYGMDIGLGHLDLGQFDQMKEVPSASFAAILIDKKAWVKVGEIDENYPLYYEDLDWSFRARGMSYKIIAAPSAVIYHAMGRRAHHTDVEDLTATKIRKVTIGRNRFVLKNFSYSVALWLMVTYWLHDCIRVSLFLLQGGWQKAAAFLSGNWQTIIRLPQILRAGKMERRKMKIGSWHLLTSNKQFPRPRIWRGIPLLTWKDIEDLADQYSSLKINDMAETENGNES